MRHSAPLVVLCLALIGASLAGQDRLFTVSSLDAKLRTIDPCTAATLSSVAITSTKNVVSGNGLATHPTTGQLWAILTVTGSTGRELARIDPQTGVATLIGDTGLKLAGIAFDAGGTLFAVTGDGAPVNPATLFTVNLTTAAPTLRVALGNGTDGEALTYDPTGQVLLHASGLGVPNVHEILETIHPQTLALTNVPLSGADTDEVLSMTPWVGRNFLVADRLDSLYVMSATGVVSKIAKLDHSAKGMATQAAGNEPYFRTYGYGCAASAGYIPVLAGSGVPGLGNQVTIRILNGPGGAPGALVIGFGQASFQLTPACAVQNLPLLSLGLSVQLGGIGSGKGTVAFPLAIPLLAPALDLYFQTGLIEGTTLIVTNPLQIHVQ